MNVPPYVKELLVYLPFPRLCSNKSQVSIAKYESVIWVETHSGQNNVLISNNTHVCCAVLFHVISLTISRYRHSRALYESITIELS